MILDTLWY